MAEFEVNGFYYRNGPMDPMMQFHVMRRLMPILSSFKDIDDLDPSEMEGESSTQSMKKMIGYIEPLAMRISELKDEDANYILEKCMSVCMRCADRTPTTGSSWAPVWPPGVARPMFQDIDMFQMLRIVYNVMLDQLGNFLPAPPSRLSVIRGGA